MKHLIFLIAVVTMLASCSKNAERDLASDPGEPVQSRIEFKIDGSLKQYFQTNAGVVHVTGENVYTFTGTKNPSGDNFFQITFMTDSLRPGTYSTTTGVVAYREGNVVVTNSSVSSADFKVTITSNVNGLINGSFKGTLYNQTANHNSTILEGLIVNIQMKY